MTEPVRYLPLLEELDRWQAGARARHPGVIPCRTGCTACCHGPFDISVADTVLVRGAVARLPEPVRERAAGAARDQLARIAALEPAWRPPYDVADLGEERFDRLSDALADLPCPLLDAEGRCVIYPDRPMICRLMGLGMQPDQGEVIENGCPIQERFPAYRDLPPERFPLAAWEDAEDRAKLAAAADLFGPAARAGYETIIAAVVAGAAGPLGPVRPDPSL